MPFAALGLAPELLRAVADEGYEQPTPIQAEAIPLALAGRDLIGSVIPSVLDGIALLKCPYEEIRGRSFV